MPDESDTAKPSPPFSQRLVVVDGANALFRAFFGVPPLRAPDGTPTNAALGFINMLMKVIREEAPTFVAVAFDPRGGSFRNRIFEGYKAGRDATPEDLIVQIPLMKELIAAFRIPLLEVEDYEADDVIATLVANAGDDIAVTIVSTDKDLMQLVSDRVTLLDGVKGRRYDPAEVEARFGMPPEKMLDWRALVGDSSDNIPGVKGIGEKGATKLITEWGTLENLLEHRAEVSAKRARTALEEYADDALLSKRLSQLDAGVELGLEFSELALQEPDRDELRTLYRRLGFTRLVEALDAESNPEVHSEEGRSSAAAATSPPERVGVTIVEDRAALDQLVDDLAKQERTTLLGVAESGSAMSARLVGLAFAVAVADRPACAFYVPITSPPESSDLLPGMDEGEAAQTQGLAAEEVASALRGLLEDERTRVAWAGTGTKDLQSGLSRIGLEVPASCFDVELAAFLLDPAGAHQLSSLAVQHLGREVPSWQDLAGRGAKAIPASQVPVADAAQWAADQVCAASALQPLLREALERDGLWPLFAEVEMPLTAVLSKMERTGVRVDEGQLAGLSLEYAKELARLEGEIYRLAGEEFLVSSPKQLQVILFEKLNLPALKKTKTGYSTDEAVLEQLTAHHELPGRILLWRRLSKLKSTYVDALPRLVNEHTGRIHPHFNQTGAATGRLSASDPNVQNIPIRTDEGVRIREAFVPAEGCELLSADYSQVELRLLAHYSNDESLIDAFRKSEDIHRRTAAEVAGISPDEVTDDQRARAKAVNFGIIYGSSAFGLANQLGIATGEAQETIDTYFERYEGVARFLEETVKAAKDTGFVTTLMGRRRYLPDLQSRNRTLRQAAERMAVNTVVQGTAADLIKKAMVIIDAEIVARELAAKVILQVHDELVFELPTSEREAVSELACECMEGVFALAVPLVVDVGYGKNWREAH